MQAFTVAEIPKVVHAVNGSMVMELEAYCLQPAAEPIYFRTRRKVFRKHFDRSGTEWLLSTFPVVPISHDHTNGLEYDLLKRGMQVWNCRHKQIVSYRERSRNGNPSVSCL